MSTGEGIWRRSEMEVSPPRLAGPEADGQGPAGDRPGTLLHRAGQADVQPRTPVRTWGLGVRPDTGSGGSA